MADDLRSGRTDPAEEALPPRAGGGALLGRGGLTGPYRGGPAAGIFALVLSGGISLVFPFAGGRIVDAALVEESLARMGDLLVGLVVLFALSGALTFVEVYSLRSAGAFLLREVRGRLHSHLLALSPAFFDQERTGDLLSRLGSDVDTIGSVLTQEFVSGLERALVLVGALAILLVWQPWLTGVMLVAVPPVVIAAVLMGMRLERLSKERQEAAAEANVAAEEALAGIRTVQAFAREPFERERYRGRLDHVVTLSLRTAMAWGIFSGVVSFLAFSALGLVLWYGGSLVVRKELTAGDLTSFVLYTGTVASAIGSLTSLYGSLRSAAGSTERVRNILETEPKVADRSGAEPAPSLIEGRLELAGVRFSYPAVAAAGGPPALDGIDLVAAPGQVVALVGPSGAGKSTVVQLLLRFHDPEEGEVRLDGRDLRTWRLADLRSAVGIVPQDIFLFGGTVAENIRYGRPDASDREVEAAAEAAQAATFVARLPRGFETAIGERGVRLSTGERQRIAIARVFLKDPRVVILDEATSALDAESERAVQSALERLLAGRRTTIVVAHRLSTVRRADQVVLLEAGRITDRGTHEELFGRSPLYRRFCELQMLDARTT